MERLRLVKRLDEELRLGLHETLVLGEGRYDMGIMMKPAKLFKPG